MICQVTYFGVPVPVYCIFLICQVIPYIGVPTGQTEWSCPSPWLWRTSTPPISGEEGAFVERWFNCCLYVVGKVMNVIVIRHRGHRLRSELDFRCQPLLKEHSCRWSCGKRWQGDDEWDKMGGGMIFFAQVVSLKAVSDQKAMLKNWHWQELFVCSTIVVSW